MPVFIELCLLELCFFSENNPSLLLVEDQFDQHRRGDRITEGLGNSVVETVHKVELLSLTV